MHTSEVKTNPSSNVGELLNNASMLETADLQQFSKQIQRLLHERSRAASNAAEVRLLTKINSELLPSEIRRRYEQLSKKLQGRNISEDERAEFLEINRQLEVKGAERLEAMLELARLRGIAFEDLLEQLGMKTPFPENA